MPGQVGWSGGIHGWGKELGFVTGGPSGTDFYQILSPILQPDMPLPVLGLVPTKWLTQIQGNPLVSPLGSKQNIPPAGWHITLPHYQDWP